MQGPSDDEIKKQAEKEKIEKFKQRGRKYKVDMRPRVFIRKMRLELLVFGFGVTCALCLPYYMKAISRKRQENRRLDLEEAYANSFGKNQSDFAKMGGVVKIDKSGNRSIINQSQDDGMDDFMREVQAANDLAREDSMSSNQSDHFGGLGSQNIQTRRFGQKSSGFTGRYNE